MNNDDQFQQYLELCKQIYLRMLEEGSWPWRDSPDSEDVLESEDNPNGL